MKRLLSTALLMAAIMHAETSERLRREPQVSHEVERLTTVEARELREAELALRAAELRLREVQERIKAAHIAPPVRGQNACRSVEVSLWGNWALLTVVDGCAGR